MKKASLWCIPTLLIAFCLTVNHFLQVKFPDVLFLAFYIFTLFIAPCYFIFLIYYVHCNKIGFIRSFLFSSFLILVNAVLICPESIQVYMGLREWDGHDIDFLPLFVVLPMLILVIAYVLVVLIRRVTRGRFC